MMMNAFSRYSIIFLSISFLGFSCDTNKIPDRGSVANPEEEPLLLPYTPDWNRYYPLYYQSTETEHLWYFMEQPVMLDAEKRDILSPSGKAIAEEFHK